MTQLSAFALYLMGAIYVFLAAYIAFGGWRQRADRRVRLAWFLLVPTSLFVTLWFAGRWIWALFYWIFVFGDAGPYEEYASVTSSVVALVAAATIFARQVFGLSNRSYPLITASCTAAIAALLLAMLTYNYSSRIDGWSAHGAAENHFARVRVETHPFIGPNAARRIVETNIFLSPEPFSKPVRRFVLYYGNGPIQEVKVAPFGWFWWTLAGSGPAYPTFEMDWAIANWESDPEKSREQLEAVIENYPNSEAARWAAKTLKSLETNGAQGVTSWQEEMLRKLQKESKRRRTAESETR